MRKDRLKTEITLALGIKALLLWLLWLAFFQQPLAERLTHKSVGDALFGPVNSRSPATSREPR